MEKWEMPTGFAMALAANAEAMRFFAALTDSEKKQAVERTHTIGSRDEMRRYVDSLAEGKKR